WCRLDRRNLGAAHDLGADAYAARGHGWLLGPVGTGFLYVRRDLLPRLEPRYRNRLDGRDLSTRAARPIEAARQLELEMRSASLAAGLTASIEWQSGLGIDGVNGQATALAARLHAGLSGIDGIEVLTPAASVQSSPVVSFRVSRRPNAQVVSWLQDELGMRLRRIDALGLDAVRASTHVVNQVRDVDWLVDAVRALA
ncbi:MAG: aminotransferase class V-fold PLP-dependent enzyme, partial [Candidatus Krumholzibacteriia bacterium]